MVNTKPIPGYPLLLASRDGTIYRKPYAVDNKRGVFRLGVKTLKPTKFVGSKYYGVKVKTGFREYKRVTVHRLVALAWHDNPDNKAQVNHKDGNPANNRADNLEWATPSENGLHAYTNGLSYVPSGEKHPAAKLTQVQAEEIRRLYDTGKYTQSQLAAQFGVAQVQIWKIVRNKRYVAQEVRDLAINIWED